jgi:hypothetical protein
MGASLGMDDHERRKFCAGRKESREIAQVQ